MRYAYRRLLKVFIKRILYWLPIGIAIGLLLGFLFFFSVDVAATNQNDNPPPIEDVTGAWINSQNNVIYKPSEPLVPVDWDALRRSQSTNKKTSNGLNSTLRCSCVLYVEWKTGINKTVGWAKYWPINSQTPTVGSIVILREGYYGHVAFVESVTDTHITISETNYVRCTFGTRTLARTYSQIRGYYVR